MLTLERNEDEDATEKFFMLCKHVPNVKDRSVGTGVPTTIQRVQKAVVVPHVEVFDKVVDVLVSVQYRVSAVVIQRTFGMLQCPFIDRVVHSNCLQVQFLCEVVDVHVVVQRLVFDGTDVVEYRGDSTGAIPGQGCLHARCCAKTGLDDADRAEACEEASQLQSIDTVADMHAAVQHQVAMEDSRPQLVGPRGATFEDQDVDSSIGVKHLSSQSSWCLSATGTTRAPSCDPMWDLSRVTSRCTMESQTVCSTWTVASTCPFQKWSSRPQC